MRFKPIYRFAIGSAEVDASDDVGSSTLVQLDLSADMALLADSAVLRLAPVGGVQPQGGEQIWIDLGFDGRMERAFTGIVAEVIVEVTTVRVLCVSPVHELVRLRVDQTYLGRSAGAIVRDLATQAGVSTGVVEDGISFPAYVIDRRLSAARHIHRLAERCGFDSYVAPDGALHFRRFAGGAQTHAFKYGEDILAYSVSMRPEQAGGVTVIGESAASARGPEAASWLTRGFRRGEAAGGRGDAQVILFDPAIRTTEAATTRAEGVLRRLRQRGRVGTLRALGRPELRLGDAARIEGAPDERLNGTYQARAVRHTLSRQAGLVTEIDLWGMP